MFVRRFAVLLVGCILLAACESPSHPAPTRTSTVTSTLVQPTPSDTPHMVRTPAPARTPSAPDERVVMLNEPVEAVYIPGQTRELYFFESDRARRVNVVLSATDGGDPLRLQAWIFDAVGELVPRVSVPVGQPSLVEAWDLPSPGVYMVQLFGPESQPRDLMLTIMAQPVPVTGGGVIAYGESRSGEIAIYGQRDRWNFQGRAGDRVLITMLAPLADPYLEVYDPAGRLLVTADDSPVLGRSPSVEIVLPADGSYTIVARIYGDDQAATYQLSLALVQDEW